MFLYSFVGLKVAHQPAGDQPTEDAAGAGLIAAAAAGDLAATTRLLDKWGDNIIESRDAEGRTALHQASAGGHTEEARLLLDRGADVNARTNNGFTPLHFASILGSLAVVELLLDRGADVNAATTGPGPC